MQLASLITAVALLLSVRGKFGVEIWAKCLTIRRLRLLANDRLAVFFKNYYKVITWDFIFLALGGQRPFWELRKCHRISKKCNSLLSPLFFAVQKLESVVKYVGLYFGDAKVL